ncbi:putative transporter SVOPL [Rana temporaria]|uniref:putative transporter SVOPL n=1 Tax=Rana temporaria TaxID=8407 RepID=UPI001AAD22BF|nr:putative transporter SVOPL [Rana temporaria]XP_040201339.1 putative transporter SVOPL [Rana temporaria]
MQRITQKIIEPKLTKYVNTIKLEEVTPRVTDSSNAPKTYSVEEAVETIGFGRFHIMLFLIMGSTGIAEAMEIMLLAVISSSIRCEWRLQSWQVALVTTMVFFGYMVFSIILGLLADRYGRLKILALSFLWGAYFSLLTSFSPSYGWFVFLRCMVGCGVSGHAQGLIIKTEFLPKTCRGYMLPLSQLFWLAGSLLIIGVGSVVNPTLGWRWLVRLASIPGIILVIVFRFIPESARFNVSVGKHQAAMETLTRIAKINHSKMPEGTIDEPAVERTGSFCDLLDRKYLRTSLQIWVIWLGISFAYYGVILASSELLERNLLCGSGQVALGAGEEPYEGSHSPCYCNMLSSSDYRTMIISTVGEIALNPFNILGINLIGRRWTLGITMTTTGIFFLLLNICMSSTGLIGILFCLRALVSANFNTIYIYTAEVYPTVMRAIGMGTSGSLCRIGAMAAPFIAQVLLSASIIGALCLFSAVCFICAISAFTLPIETKGRALQQVK